MAECVNDVLTQRPTKNINKELQACTIQNESVNNMARLAL
jgi:hypothetical protein